MELRGYVQTYKTGQLGETSIVSRLHWTPKNKERKIEETAGKHYAELWIGTNPKGEAFLRKTKEKLSNFIAKHPHILGISSYLFKDKLPFILKILSVASPTPMRIHPSEHLASKLNEQIPSLDFIHKPVLLIALTDFEMMAGFRPKNQIIYYLTNVPELNELIKPKLLEDYLRTEKTYYLRKIFECYMSTEEDKLIEVIDKYFNRMETEDYVTIENHLLELVTKLHELFPYDKGVFMIFFLNHFTLNKYEAIYIRPLTPYSYFYGEAVECSTNSNYDIPITFTDDIKQVSLFIDNADFTPREIDEMKVTPRFEPYLTIYDCDEDEFVVTKIEIAKDEYYSIHGKRSICIFIIMKGMAITTEQIKIKAGTIILVPSCHTYHLKAIEEMTLFMAEPNLVI